MDRHRLKKSVPINGKPYEIRSDYGAVLDIIEALNDPELDDRDKIEVVLTVFYPAYEDIPEEDIQEAVNQCIAFINYGDNADGAKKPPKLVDWTQDFPIVVGAINRVLGYDIRSVPYDEKANTGGVSWETFISAYYEIGECLFSQVVSIRYKLAKGKKLEKHEQEWLRQNRHLVDFKRKYTEADDDLLSMWV